MNTFFEFIKKSWNGCVFFRLIVKGLSTYLFTIVVQKVSPSNSSIEASLEEASVKIFWTIIGTIFWELQPFLKEINTNYTNIKEELRTSREHFNHLVGNADIVLKIDIEPLNDNHIKALQKILTGLPNDVNTIYAIDNSDPRQWWSESMLGYLAIQSSWVRRNNVRKVKRFFVFKNIFDVNSKSTQKLIFLHILNGLDTYIILQNDYEKLFNNFKPQDVNLNYKEFFIWNDITEQTNHSNAKITEINDLIDKPILGYQSFWDIDSFYSDRGDVTAINQNGHEIGKVKDLNLQFDFITNRFYNIAESYNNFAKHLCNEAIECTDAGVVRVRNPKLVYLDPKKFNGENGTPLNLSRVKEILDEYFKLNKR